MSIRELLDPTNSALIFIDHQPQMSFGVANIDRQTLKNNTVALAKAGKIFNVPVIYTSVETKSFSGYIWPELLAVHPDVKPIIRTSMNSWEDDAFVAAVKATGRKKAGDLRSVDRSLPDVSGADGPGGGIRSVCGHRYLRRYLCRRP